MRSITVALIALMIPLRAYAVEDDAQAFAMKARQLVASGSPQEGLAYAQRVINLDESTVPTWIRQLALEAAMKASATMKDVDGETRYALLLNSLSSAQYPEARRRYARMPWVDAVCDRYDRKNGAGSCALFALKLTGVPALKDKGTGKRVKTLGDEDVARSHKEYLPLIHDCVAAAAHADPDRFENETATVSWGIDQSGRAVEIEVQPRRMKSDAGACIEERLSWFRYPRSDSQEMKFVSLSFELTSVIRTQTVSTD